MSEQSAEKSSPIGRTPPDAWLKLLSDPNRWSAPTPRPTRLETERLVVRMYEPGDARQLFEAVDGDRANLLPWMVWAQSDHMNETDSAYFIEMTRRKWEQADGTDFVMGIFDKATGRLVGGTGLHRIRPGVREAEIGYWVLSSVRGTGICTESTGGLISAALRSQDEGGWGFRRIVVFNAVQNIGSRRVCEKLGLRLEQRTKQDRFAGSLGDHEALGYHDSLGYAVLADEWDFDRDRAKEGIGWRGLQPD
ncbi:MAG: GNAT family N-acetyltransferase [Phycisphaerales bacterium JB065]